jgi:hypothetical protein
VLPFTVEITGAGSGSDVDSARETSSQGSLNINVTYSSAGTGQSHTATPGHKYIDSLTLRGPLTARSNVGRVIRNEASRALWCEEHGRTMEADSRCEGNFEGQTAGREFEYQEAFPAR